MPRDKVEKKIQSEFENRLNPRPKRKTKKERELSQREQRTARRIENLVKRTARRRQA